MKIAAVIPMKKLHLAKSRLSNTLSPQQRKNLAMFLLDATIKELKESNFISEIIIVSSDKAIKKYSYLNNLKFIHVTIIIIKRLNYIRWFSEQYICTIQSF